MCSDLKPSSRLENHRKIRNKGFQGARTRFSHIPGDFGERNYTVEIIYLLSNTRDRTPPFFLVIRTRKREMKNILNSNKKLDCAKKYQPKSEKRALRSAEMWMSEKVSRAVTSGNSPSGGLRVKVFTFSRQIRFVRVPYYARHRPQYLFRHSHFKQTVKLVFRFSVDIFKFFFFSFSSRLA